MQLENERQHFYASNMEVHITKVFEDDTWPEPSEWHEKNWQDLSADHAARWLTSFSRFGFLDEDFVLNDEVVAFSKDGETNRHLRIFHRATPEELQARNEREELIETRRNDDDWEYSTIAFVLCNAWGMGEKVAYYPECWDDKMPSNAEELRHFVNDMSKWSFGFEQEYMEDDCFAFYLSPTALGHVHDSRIANEFAAKYIEPKMPEGWCLQEAAESLIEICGDGVTEEGIVEFLEEIGLTRNPDWEG